WPSLKKHLIDQNGGRDSWDIFISTWKPDPKSLVKEQPGDRCDLQEVLDLYQPIYYNVEVYNEDKKRELAEKVELEDFWNYCRSNKFEIKREGRWRTHNKKCEVCGHKTAKNRDKCRCCGGPLIFNSHALFYSILKASHLRQKYEQDNNFKYDL